MKKLKNQKNLAHFSICFKSCLLGAISRSLTHKTKIWHNNPLSRRFGKYSFYSISLGLVNQSVSRILNLIPRFFGNLKIQGGNFKMTGHVTSLIPCKDFSVEQSSICPQLPFKNTTKTKKHYNYF